MNVSEIFPCLPSAVVSGPREGEATFVTDDSRKAGPEGVFVAIRGVSSDGHDYITQAIEQGATVIVAETGPPEGFSKTWVKVENSRSALAILADWQFGSPSTDLKLIGVTGTNGKTTVAYLAHYLLKELLHRAGMIGTVITDDGVTAEPSAQTTPGVLAVQQILDQMRDNGCRAAVMEVSSHGLEQGRVDGVMYDVGIFTNLTQDHLDYHGTMDAYFAAKCLLFRSLSKGTKEGVGVINGDDRYGVEILKDYKDRLKLVSYGFSAGCDFCAGSVKQTFRGMEFQLDAKGKSFLVRVPLIGRFNVMNTLAVLAAANAIGIPLREAVAALKSVPGVPGRLEFVGRVNDASIFVDYAHTPDALANACRTLRELEPKNLVTVFGCGGDRDRGKRVPMARAAEKESSLCIVTSDNPRKEDPENIIRDIVSGFVGKAYHAEVDRRAAINLAIENAQPGDIVLIAGKGHEDYQIFKDETVRFDDRIEVREAIGRVERKRRRDAE